MSRKKYGIKINLKMLLASVFITLLVLIYSLLNNNGNNTNRKIPVSIPSLAVTIIPTPTPTSKPLTFSELNKLYGPCVNLPTLMYHHIQDKKTAEERYQVSLTTYTDTFEEQMKFLHDNNYVTIDIGSLINFFNDNSMPPEKAVLLTFDDGYYDFLENAYSILKKYGFKSIVFLPTGLMNNPGYLSWNDVSSLSETGLVYFGNHTWSHYGLSEDREKIISEIQTADDQLFEKNLNSFKIYAYPYGMDNKNAKDVLTNLNYNLAFTTNYGKTLCAKKRLELPRLRAGNLNLKYYGF